MYKTIKIEAAEFKVTRIKADGTELMNSEGIEGFAKVWLALTNNRKAYPNEILKVYNDYDNGVYVVCDSDEENVASVKDYLTRLGLTIESEEEIKAIQPDEVYYDDIDTELIEW